MSVSKLLSWLRPKPIPIRTVWFGEDELDPQDIPHIDRIRNLAEIYQSRYAQYNMMERSDGSDIRDPFRSSLWLFLTAFFYFTFIVAMILGI